MSTSQGPVATKIILHKKSRTLEIEFAQGESFVIPCAVLRLHSRSAEMRGQEEKQLADFANINILSIEPVGQYAIKPIFSDGHRTGIFSWQTLYDLGIQYGSRGT
jgi:DUF971 family protein